VRHMDERKPMMVGFAGLVLSQVLLIVTPARNYPLLLAALLLESCSIPMAATLLDKLIVVNVAPKDRARIMAILSVVVIVCMSPFGWIAGQLSEANRSLPFVLNIALFGTGVLLMMMASRWAKDDRRPVTVDRG
jgi:MFS family permease